MHPYEGNARAGSTHRCGACELQASARHAGAAGCGGWASLVRGRAADVPYEPRCGRMGDTLFGGGAFRLQWHCSGGTLAVRQVSMATVRFRALLICAHCALGLRARCSAVPFWCLCLLCFCVYFWGYVTAVSAPSCSLLRLLFRAGAGGPVCEMREFTAAFACACALARERRHACNMRASSSLTHTYATARLCASSPAPAAQWRPPGARRGRQRRHSGDRRGGLLARRRRGGSCACPPLALTQHQRAWAWARAGRGAATRPRARCVA